MCEGRPGSEFSYGANLILVHFAWLAIDLLIFVEARLVIEIGMVQSLNFTTIVERDHAGVRAAGKDGKAQRE